MLPISFISILKSTSRGKQNLSAKQTYMEISPKGTVWKDQRHNILLELRRQYSLDLIVK